MIYIFNILSVCHLYTLHIKLREKQKYGILLIYLSIIIISHTNLLIQL